MGWMTTTSYSTKNRLLLEWVGSKDTLFPHLRCQGELLKSWHLSNRDENRLTITTLNFGFEKCRRIFATKKSSHAPLLFKVGAQPWQTSGNLTIFTNPVKIFGLSSIVIGLELANQYQPVPSDTICAYGILLMGLDQHSLRRNHPHIRLIWACNFPCQRLMPDEMMMPVIHAIQCKIRCYFLKYNIIPQ